MRDVFLVELRQALRVFRRSPGFVAAVLLTLSIGIGGTTSIFSLVNGLLLRPLPGIQEANRLVAVRSGRAGGALGVASYMDFLDFKERSRSFESLAAFKPRQVDASLTGAIHHGYIVLFRRPEGAPAPWSVFFAGRRSRPGRASRDGPHIRSLESLVRG